MKHKKTYYTFLLLLGGLFFFIARSTQEPEWTRPAQTHKQSGDRLQTGSPLSASDAAPKPKADLQSESQPLDAQGRPLYKPGELLIKFKEGVSAKEMEALHKNLGSTVISMQPRQKIARVKIRSGLSEKDAIGLYAVSPIVDIVERHALRYPQEVPDDPFFSDQWALPKISAPGAWNFTQCSPDVIIAVIDTGVDYNHPDLAENIWTNSAEANGAPGVDDDNDGYVDDLQGWDFADDNNSPVDTDGHGTHVAGVISALGNNAVGTAGVCWKATLMPLKVQADGASAMESMAIINAIYYAMDHGARIINCSFGGTAYSQLEYSAFATLKRAGILAVCAAGNSGLNSDLRGNKNYPSCYDLDNIISVAATTDNDDLASFSTYGLLSVDIAAPGVDILSTTLESTLRDSRVIVHGTSGDVTVSAIAMLYAGITDEAGIIGTAYDCGLGYPENFPKEVSGQIALIRRGEIYFSEKTSNAMKAGARAAIIDNNVVDSLDQVGGTLGTTGDWIPVVSISMADGESLREMGTPLVTIVNAPLSSSAAYSKMSGTSFAAPHVTGAAGLILSKTPGMDYVRLRAALLNTVDKLPALEGKIASGGRLNALAALCSANTLPADLSFDQTLGLEDAVIAVRIGAGITDSPPICPVSMAPSLDINGNHTIGPEEAVYILRNLAGTE